MAEFDRFALSWIDFFERGETCIESDQVATSLFMEADRIFQRQVLPRPLAGLVPGELILWQVLSAM